MQGQSQEQRVVCKVCWSGCQKSIVYPKFYQAPLGEGTCFYDEEGRYHVHDSKEKKTQYKCSNGHEWEQSMTDQCWCGWVEGK
jgi:hypothetical protein